MVVVLSFVPLQRMDVWGQESVRIGLGSLTFEVHEIARPQNSRMVVYPREYSVYTQLRQSGSMGCVYGGGFVMTSRDFEARWYYPTGAKNETLPDLGWYYVGDDNPPNTIPYFALDATTTYYQDKVHTTIPISLVRYWKYEAPLRMIDGTDYSTPDWLVIDRIKPDMISEQMGVATCNTSMGVSLTQRAYAFANPDFDDFVIVEYILKNTGNIDSDAEIEYPNNRVKAFYFGLKFIPKPSGLTGLIVSGSGGWSEGNDDWIDYYGETYRDWVVGGSGDSLRVMYGWDGDANATYCAPDDEGDPLPASGIFMSPQYPGMAILHVDKAPDDPADDHSQPVSSYYSWGGHISTNQLSLVNTGLGQIGVYNILKDGGYFTGPLDWDIWNESQGAIETWAADAANGDPNARYYKTGALGFGPYDFNAIGDSIRIVTCYTVGSIGWAKAIELGEQWRNGEISKTEKNWWLRTGRDSLFAKIGRIRALFEKSDGDYDFTFLSGSTIDQNIPDPPRWPDLMISAGIEKITLGWSDVDADAYRVYRRLQPEFYLEDPGVETYPLVHETTGDVLSWEDKTITPGQNYWYYVTAVRDDMESSRFVNRTNPSSTSPLRGSVNPTRGAEKTLDNVHVVPNPYHTHAYRLHNWAENRINFVGLPAECRIRIYTQTGDLVAILQHELTMPPSSIESWLQITESDQYIASGLYIYVIDRTRDHEGNDLGLTKTGKFVVIR